MKIAFQRKGNMKMRKVIVGMVVVCMLVLSLAACSAVDSGESYDEPSDDTQFEPEGEPEPEIEDVAPAQDGTAGEDGIDAGADNTGIPNEDAPDLSSFDIRGTWKSIGETGTGQAQPGAIVNFSDHECNLYSPRDTYALYMDGGKLKLDATGLLGGTPSFTVTVIDNDNIVLDPGSSHETTLRRVG
jgi:hypothetical protein